jgi:hypothetical protein
MWRYSKIIVFDFGPISIPIILFEGKNRLQCPLLHVTKQKSSVLLNLTMSPNYNQ